MMRFSAMIVLILSSLAFGQGRPLPQWQVMETPLRSYFSHQVEKVGTLSLAGIQSMADWQKQRSQYRRQLAEMLGLWPEPERTDLKATVTGTLQHPEFTIEKLHFQSRPGLYVTANLYVPTKREKPVPAILYVSGHGTIKKNGINYGAKAYFHQHGAWLARHGYVCLVLDTLQLGEIEGIHHGLYREKMWWWISRGYTPAGVEAWNGIRAIDYLQTRPEVDKEKIGITGRSGGGAYSWWVAALDERVTCAVPVAGIADIHNHIVDGAIEGHCDCMYMVNQYRWDFDKVAALVSPRALLVANTDKDEIFPLDGVVDVYNGARRIYELQAAQDRIGLLITEGGHKDTQDLQVPTLRWFDRFLQGKKDSIITIPMQTFFEPEQLKVFAKLPEDQRNTTAHEWFVPAAELKVPQDKKQWEQVKAEWMKGLREKVFAAWPVDAGKVQAKTLWSKSAGGLSVQASEFDSEQGVRLKMYVLKRDPSERPDRVTMQVLDDAGWARWSAMMRGGLDSQAGDFGEGAKDESGFSDLARTLRSRKEAIVLFAPRGVGPTRWTDEEKKRTQIRRRFWLLGQSDDGMRVWDVTRAAQVVRELERAPIRLHAERRMAGVAVYAALFADGVESLTLREMPVSHRHGPDLLNVMKVLDLPAAVALVCEKASVTLHGAPRDWAFAAAVAQKMGWKERLAVVE